MAWNNHSSRLVIYPKTKVSIPGILVFLEVAPFDLIGLGVILFIVRGGFESWHIYRQL